MIIIHVLLVINQEKTIQNIEGFDKNKLKHAETKEKNPLPDKAGEIILFPHPWLELKANFCLIVQHKVEYTDVNLFLPYVAIEEEKRLSQGSS